VSGDDDFVRLFRAEEAEFQINFHEGGHSAFFHARRDIHPLAAKLPRNFFVE
jgi:hypothetical protein